MEVESKGDRRNGKPMALSSKLLVGAVLIGLTAFMVLQRSRTTSLSETEADPLPRDSAAVLGPFETQFVSATSAEAERVSQTLSTTMTRGEDVVATNPLPEVADPAGVTPSMRMEYLVNAHADVQRICSNESINQGHRVRLQRLFLLRCAGTILYARGRALFDLEQAKLDASFADASDPDRYSFSMDGATYEFFR